jgi:hypothetical protein
LPYTTLFLSVIFAGYFKPNIFNGRKKKKKKRRQVGKCKPRWHL